MSEVTVIKKLDTQVGIFLIASFLCEFNILTNAGQLMQSLPSSSTLQGPLGEYQSITQHAVCPTTLEFLQRFKTMTHQ